MVLDSAPKQPLTGGICCDRSLRPENGLTLRLHGHNEGALFSNQTGVTDKFSAIYEEDPHDCRRGGSDRRRTTDEVCGAGRHRR